MLKQALDVVKYKQVRDEAKKYFEALKTGDQSLYTDQTKLFQPLIDTSKESSKTVQDQIIAGQNGLARALVPFTTELKKRNEQVETLQSLPFYLQEIAASTPKKKDDRCTVV